ncbi:MAG: 6-phosphogluconolactonase [Bacteroidales bacterium]|nr:6-phosphogluconolactonase [Bacteroidales bacterium]
MNKKFKIFPTPYELAEKFAEEMVGMIRESAERRHLQLHCRVDLLLNCYSHCLGSKYAKAVSWRNVHLFWGDERCVAPDSPESNFGMTKRKLIDKIEIPASNIHRIKGEEDPAIEAVRYSDEILSITQRRSALPLFDLFILGLGDDGHTASIFPGNLDLLNSEKICDVAVHPVSNQKRITITGRIINNASRVVFLVTGKKKADIVEKIINNRAEALPFPASHIAPAEGMLTWYVDKESASLL